MDHKRTLGILHIIYGALTVIPSAIVIFLLSGIGLLSGDPETLTIFSVVGSLIAGILIVMATPSLIAGIGLLNNTSWGLILALVIGVINILYFPFGTALGIYSIYVYNLESQK